jgi:hypothetical protein
VTPPIGAIACPAKLSFAASTADASTSRWTFDGLCFPPVAVVDHELCRRCALRFRPPKRELLAERRRQVHLSDVLRRLRVDDVERAGTEVRVLPAQGERLADPQAAAGEHSE